MLKRIVFTIYHLPKTMESIEDHLLKLRLNRRYVKTINQYSRAICYSFAMENGLFIVDVPIKTGNFPIDIQFFSSP